MSMSTTDNITCMSTATSSSTIPIIGKPTRQVSNAASTPFIYDQVSKFIVHYILDQWCAIIDVSCIYLHTYLHTLSSQYWV